MISFLAKYYKGKNILITGHSGFKGAWLSNLLILLGANVFGISLKQTNKDHIFYSSNIDKKIKNYYCDIRNQKKLNSIMKKIKPDYIFHLAAQSLVPKSFQDPFETWTVNLLGTLNVIETSKKIKNCKLILITSDKCYKNNEWIWGYREIDQLGGEDPYSASKAACELLINSHYNILKNNNYSLKIASARAGNVIGGGDWSEGRLIPDCFKAWKSRKSVKIRNFNSTRPWQFVLEPLVGYLRLGIYLSKSNQTELSFNFGPDSKNEFTVEEVLKKINKYYPISKWQKYNNKRILESNLLKLNSEKSLKILNWSCLLNFDETVKLTTDWYVSQQNKIDMEKFTIEQINYYFSRNKN